MNHTEQPAEVQSPAQRAGITAVLVCLAYMACLFRVGKILVGWLPVWGVGFLIYALLPIALTFTILHVSCIHREMSKAARGSFLLLISLLIYGLACLALGVIAFIALASLPLGRFHY